MAQGGTFLGQLPAFLPRLCPPLRLVPVRRLGLRSSAGSIMPANLRAAVIVQQPAAAAVAAAAAAGSLRSFSSPQRLSAGTHVVSRTAFEERVIDYEVRARGEGAASPAAAAHTPAAS